ncbi:MAG: outer membrane beta-barrel protein [Gammaproteobacteria bacterium]
MFRPILVALACCFSAIATAADNGVYIGAGALQSEYGLENPGDAQPFDDGDNGYKLIVGFRPLDSFGVELNYADHGDATVPSGIVCIQLINAPCPDETGLEAKTLSAFAVGFIDFPVLDLFAKVGATAWEFKGQSTPAFPAFSIDEDGTEFAWGAGLQAHFGSLAARLEYEQLNIIEDEKLGTISLSFIYTFL